MKSKPQNLPAFPTCGFERDRYNELTKEVEHTGMTLRDYFAAMALQGICSDRDWMAEICATAKKIGVSGDQIVAARCYALADAMLKVREEGKGTP